MRSLQAFACALALALYAYSQLARPLWPAARARDLSAMFQPAGLLTGNDFKHIYLGAAVLAGGGNPYDRSGPPMSLALPYVYLPFTAQVLRPLAWFGAAQAFLLWFLASHAMIALAAAAAFAALRMRWDWENTAFAAALLAASHPWWRNLSAGQLNAPLALAYPLFWWALTRRKSWLAGFVGAFAALFKLSPGILALYLLWTRRWRALGWMALWGALLLGASTAAAGPRLQWAFLPVLREMGYGRSTDAELAFYREPANQSFNSLFHHLFAPWEGFEPLWALGPGVADAATRAASFALLALVLWISRPRQAARNERAEALCFSLFIFLSLLLPSLCWDHYFVQLFFPVLAVWDALRRGGGRGSLAAPLALCAGCLAYLALPHLPSLARMGDPFWLPPALGALAAGWMFRGRRDWALGALFLVALCIVSFPFYFAADAWKTGVGALAMSWKLWGALGLFAAAAWLCVEGGEREGADAARAWAER